MKSSGVGSGDHEQGMCPCLGAGFCHPIWMGIARANWSDSALSVCLSSFWDQWASDLSREKWREDDVATKHTSGAVSSPNSKEPTCAAALWKELLRLM